MANVLNVALVESIQSLFAQGWSRRRIARELRVDRETVGKYVSAWSCGQNPPNLPTGSPGPASKCEALRELIAAKVAEGLTARRIHQVLGGGASGVGYDNVRRFIQRLGRTRPLPFRCMERAPGEEAQVDFGSGAPVRTPVALGRAARPPAAADRPPRQGGRLPRAEATG